MTERLVECQDCGYRWESSAESPRCAKSDCGRSRNVEPVADDVQDDVDDVDEQIKSDGGHEKPDEGGDAEAGRGTSSGESNEGTDEDNGSAGYTPAFETTQTRTDTDRPTASPTQPTDDDEQDDQDEEADEDLEAAPDELPDLDPEQLMPALEATFGAAATKRGEHWELNEEEAEQLAKGWTPVINHYAPHVFKQYTEIGAALIVTYTVLGPRLAEDKRQAELEEKAEEDTDAEGSVRQPRIEDDGDDLELEDVDEQINAEAPAETTNEQIGGYASV